MKFDLDLGDELVELIATKYPNLPKGKTWIKYGKKRIYFNEKKDKIDYGFFIQFYGDRIEVSEILEEYWFERLDISSEDEFKHQIELLYFSVAYPIEEKLPVTTVGQIKIYKRFEAIINDETDTKLILRPIYFEIDYEMDRDKIENVLKSDRKFQGRKIVRIIIKNEFVHDVADEIDRLEDEADQLLMQKMTSSLGDKIRVDSDEDKN